MNRRVVGGEARNDGENTSAGVAGKVGVPPSPRQSGLEGDWRGIRKAVRYWVLRLREREARLKISVVILVMFCAAHLFVDFQDTSNPTRETHTSSRVSALPFTQDRFTQRRDSKAPSETAIDIVTDDGLRSQYRELAKELLASLEKPNLRPSKLARAFQTSGEPLLVNSTLFVVVENHEMKIERHFSDTDVQSKPRYESAIALLHDLSHTVDPRTNQTIIDRSRLPKRATFLIDLTDGGWSLLPVFSIARHEAKWWKSIPFPIGSSRGKREGFGTEFPSWDAYVESEYTNTSTEWDQKDERAVFRGGLRFSEIRAGSCYQKVEGTTQGFGLGELTKPQPEAVFGDGDNGKETEVWKYNISWCKPATVWNGTLRLQLWRIAQENPKLFDVAFTKLVPNFSVRSRSNMTKISPVPLEPKKFMRISSWSQYRYVLVCGMRYEGNNQRLRNLLFLNSAVVWVRTYSHEWFHPMLRAWVHYIPVSPDLSDLVTHLNYAQRNPLLVQKIIRNANQFAHQYLSKRGQLLFAETLIAEYAAIQHD